MIRRFILVGIMVVVQNGTMLQLLIGTLVAAILLFFQVQAAPYRRMGDDQLAGVASFSLLILFLCSTAFKYCAVFDLEDINAKMSREQTRTYIIDTVSLGVITLLSVIALLIASTLIFIMQVAEAAASAHRAELADRARRLRYDKGDKEVEVGAPVVPHCTPPDFPPTYAMGAVGGSFHVFLSHVWGTGQDQVRIVKQRLLEMIPDIKAFLDVDDLKEGKGAEYVDVSTVSLVLCSRGYFVSANCMRELLRAVVTRKPILALLEPERNKGGLSREEIRQQLADAAASAAGAPSPYAKWGLDAEVESWGYAMPSAEELYGALFAAEPLEWNRIGVFQDVTMRLLAERLIPSERLKAGGGKTYIKGELSQEKVRVGPPSAGRKYHVYCSPHVAGGVALMDELSAHCGCEVLTTQSIDQLPQCDYFLLYLHGETWTSGEASADFGNEVLKAMDANARLLPAHEMSGVGGQEARFGCAFDEFFLSPPDGTPPELLRRGIYSTIAIAMKGGAWRGVSMVTLAKALNVVAGGGTPDDAAPGKGSSSEGPTGREKLGRLALRLPSRSRTARGSRTLSSLLQRGKWASGGGAKYGAATLSATTTLPSAAPSDVAVEMVATPSASADDGAGATADDAAPRMPDVEDPPASAL